MEEDKIVQLKPKIKLSEIKAIQKDKEAFDRIFNRQQELLARAQLSQSEENESGDDNSNDSQDSSISSEVAHSKPTPQIMDREAKKMIQLELLFKKKELELQRKQDLKDKREQKKVKILLNQEKQQQQQLEKNISGLTNTTDNPDILMDQELVLPELNSMISFNMISMDEEVIKKKRGRKPGSISKNKVLPFGKIGKRLGKKRGRKPKHLKDKLMRQAALLKLKLQQKIIKKNTSLVLYLNSVSNEGCDEERDNSESMQLKRHKVADIESKLQQEADEMQFLLREKNWYRRYAAKIASEEADKLKNLAVIISQKQTEQATQITSSTVDLEDIIRQTQQAQQSFNRENIFNQGCRPSQQGPWRYEMLMSRLKSIHNQEKQIMLQQSESEQPVVHLCITQTKSQVKQLLQKASTQLERTKAIMNEMRNIQEIKRELEDMGLQIYHAQDFEMRAN